MSSPKLSIRHQHQAGDDVHAVAVTIYKLFGAEQEAIIEILKILIDDKAVVRGPRGCRLCILALVADSSEEAVSKVRSALAPFMLDKAA